MVTLFSTGCPKCKVIKTKLEQSSIEHKIVEDLIELNKFADEHDIHEAPFLVLDDGTILNFKDSLKYISNN